MRITLHDPPDGYEAEAEWRVPQDGDTYLNPYDGKPCLVAGRHDKCQIVLTPKWVQPSCLKPGWIARCWTERLWTWCQDKPTNTGNMFIPPVGVRVGGMTLILRHLNIDLPDIPPERWRESLREIE
jgi:hypothetical protein